MSDKYCPAGKPVNKPMSDKPIQQICHETQIQNCHLCHDLNCGDNMNKEYTAGRRAGLQEAREAVANVLSWRSNTSGIEWDCHRDDALAAIDRLMERE